MSFKLMKGIVKNRSNTFLIEWLLWYFLKNVKNITGVTVTRAEVEALYLREFWEVMEEQISGLDLLIQAGFQFHGLKLETKDDSPFSARYVSGRSVKPLVFAEFFCAYLLKNIGLTCEYRGHLHEFIDRMKSRKVKSNSMFRRTMVLFVLAWRKVLLVRVLQYHFMSNLQCFAKNNSIVFKNKETFIMKGIGGPKDFLLRCILAFGHGFVLSEGVDSVKNICKEIKERMNGYKTSKKENTEDMLIEFIAVSDAFDVYQDALNTYCYKRLKYTEMLCMSG